VARLVAGLDGGQSSTIALIADERGRVVARGAAGPADEVGAGPNSTRLRDALRSALDDARRHAQLPDETEFAAIVAGVSGYDGRVRGRAPEMPSPRFLLLHDAPVAHAGALGGRPGIIVIAGTGSVVYARDAAGAERTLGGWGYLFGDEGSAFRIAADALSAIMRAHDEGDPAYDAEASTACEFFGVDSLRRLAHAFYKGDVGRDRLASFAPIALRSHTLRPIAERGADRLAALVGVAVRAGAPPLVGLVGGVFADTAFRERLCGAIVAGVAGAEIVAARYEPAAGALLLAYREAGFETRELLE
jgi:glucosamine kinase